MVTGSIKRLRLPRPEFIAMTILLVVQFIVCLALMQQWFWQDYLGVSIGFLGFTIGTIGLLAVFLAWAPDNVWKRIVVVALFLLISSGACALGAYFSWIYDSRRFAMFSNQFNEAAQIILAFLPVWLATVSLPCWIMRIARGWKWDRVELVAEEANASSRYSYTELAGCLLVFTIAVPITLAPFTNGGDALMALGIYVPSAFLIGTLFVFPIAWLLLGSKRYWLWAIAISACCGLMGISLAALVFWASRRSSGGMMTPDVFFVSYELQTCLTIFLCIGLTMTVILVGARMAGLVLIRPRYQPPQRQQTSRSAVHPLDD